MKKLISFMLMLVMLAGILPAYAETGLSAVLANQAAQAESAQAGVVPGELAQLLSGEKSYVLNWVIDYSSSTSSENKSEQLQGGLMFGRGEGDEIQFALYENGQAKTAYVQDKTGYAFTGENGTETGLLTSLANIESLTDAQFRALAVALYLEEENHAVMGVFAQALLEDMLLNQDFVALLQDTNADGAVEFALSKLIDLVQVSLENLTIDMDTLNALTAMPALDWIGVPENSRRMYVMKLFRYLNEKLETIPNQAETYILIQQTSLASVVSVNLAWTDSLVEIAADGSGAMLLNLRLNNLLDFAPEFEATIGVESTETGWAATGSAGMATSELGVLAASIAGAAEGGLSKWDVVAVGGDAMLDVRMQMEQAFVDSLGAIDSGVAVPEAEPTVAPTAEPTPVPTEAPVVSLQINNPMQAGVAVGDAEESSEPAAEPTAASVAEPTPEPAAEPTPEPAANPDPVIVPFGEKISFDAQIRGDGTARLYDDGSAYETLNFTLGVNAHKDPAYFEKNYADSFNLNGTEAAVQFNISLNGYQGAQTIVPQNIILITMLAEDGVTAVPGYQLMDAEMAGNTGVAVESDAVRTLYKRYPWDENQQMRYMVVNAFVDGVTHTYWFDLVAANPEPAVDAEPEATEVPETEVLAIGSSGDEVKRLQAELIDLGLLFGSPDGKFGRYTEEAVKEMQRRFGMEQTGIADAGFLARLYD